MSPDGRLVAAGGWDAAANAKGNYGIYVFDGATGASIRRLGAFPNRILDIAFSEDNQRLAVALKSGEGIRVLDVASGQELMADADFGGKDSYGVVFAADGSLFAVGLDGTVRRYGPDLKRTARVANTGGQEPFSVAADPTGKRLAVGYVAPPVVEIYDAATLGRVAVADTTGVTNGSFTSIAWSRDGAYIFAGRSGFDGNEIRSWTRDGRRVGSAAASNAITSLTLCGDAIAFGSADPAFGLLKADGTAVKLGDARTANMQGKVGDAFTVSGDGKQVRFGLAWSADKPVIFDLTRSVLADAVKPPPGLAGPKIDGLAVTDWQDSFAPRFAGQPIPSAPNEFSGHWQCGLTTLASYLDQIFV
jgi:hypothetical protein